MARKLSTLFAKTGRRAAQAFTEGGNALAAIDDLGAEVNAVFTQHYGTVIDTFAGRVFSAHEAKQQIAFYDLVDKFIRTHGAAMVVAVTNTTRDQIRNAIAIAQADGLGVDATAKFIVDRTSGAIGRSRAATIARTETHAAASYATDEATRQLNLPNQKKRWVSVGDSRTRPSHAAANGQEVLIDEAFLIRDKGAVIAMKYPHDGNGGASNNINCRCIAVYFTDDDDLFDDLDTTEGRQRPTQSAVKPPPKKPEKVKVSIASLVNTGAERGALFDEKLNDWLSPLTASVASKLPLPRTVTDSKSGFMAYSGELSSHLDRSILPHEYGHHIDQQLGTRMGIRRPWGANHWSDNNLTKPWAEDRKTLKLRTKATRDAKLREIYNDLFEEVKYTKKVNIRGEMREFEFTRADLKFEGADALSDIADSMTKGYFRNSYSGAYGHKPSYWSRKGSAEKEAFANLYAIQDRPEAMKIARKHFPQLVKAFEEVLEEFDATGEIIGTDRP